MSRRRKGGGPRGGPPPQRVEFPDGDERMFRTGDAGHLGNLGGSVADRVVATFDYFGETGLAVNPDVSEVTVIDFMDAANRVDVSDPQGLTLVKDWARAMVAPADFDRFWAATRANRQSSMQITKTIWSILDGIAARPTMQPSDSSAGLPATRTTSPGVSSSPGADPLAERWRAGIAKIEARTDEMGNVMPINAAIAAQWALAAEAAGIDVGGGPPPLGERTG